MGRNALLGRAKQESGHQPLVEGNMRTLEHRADLNRELLAASVALVVALTPRDRRGLVHDATVTARAAIGPKQGFQPCARLVSVVENLVIQLACHWKSPYLRGLSALAHAESSI